MIAERATTSRSTVARCSLVDSAATVWAVLHAAADAPADAEVRADTERALRVLEQRLGRLGISEQDLRAHLERRYRRPSPPPTNARPDNVHCLRSYAHLRGLGISQEPGPRAGA
jgi:hypothetical protein